MFEYDGFSFPSKIVKINVKGNHLQNNYSYNIFIPEKEVFRVKEIFKQNEYGLFRLNGQHCPLMAIDIGANVGIFALYLKSLHAQNIIHCFEPVPSTLDLLYKNVVHIDGIYVHPFGLSDKSGTDKFYIHRQNTGQNSTKKLSNEISDEMELPVKNAIETINDLDVDRINVLKIDTEGSEIEILRSMNKRLSDIDCVLVEYHCESDRRQIDTLLNHFYLYSCQVSSLGLGIVKYINKKLID